MADRLGALAVPLDGLLVDLPANRVVVVERAAIEIRRGGVGHKLERYFGQDWAQELGYAAWIPPGGGCLDTEVGSLRKNECQWRTEPDGCPCRRLQPIRGDAIGCNQDAGKIRPGERVLLMRPLLELPDDPSHNRNRFRTRHETGGSIGEVLDRHTTDPAPFRRRQIRCCLLKYAFQSG